MRASFFVTPVSTGTVATLSTTVRCGNRPACWMTYPIPRRSSAGSVPVMSSPSMRIRPAVGSIIRLIMRSEVVLPHPEGPTSTVMAPSGMVMLR